ncbi:MAG TPA: RecX family transcriptional regulator [Smithella sp.]|nr:RecX family transcriptional regulator [Smithella sp.]HOG10921.1 RecX family transcriptional regulator [Smithella sp.]HOS15079.1 RecX family transcriptional regulator [Smithella sp.]
MKVLDLEAAKQKAFRLLSLRPHSEKELEKKLREKGFPAVVIKETLEKLHDLKYLNDASFANQWARNLVVNKLWGNKKVAASLREKGLTAELMELSIEKAREELPEEAALEILIKKKAAKNKSAALDFKEKQKIFQALMGRGFPPGLILNKLGRIKKEDIDGKDWE